MFRIVILLLREIENMKRLSKKKIFTIQKYCTYDYVLLMLETFIFNNKMKIVDIFYIIYCLSELH